MDDHAERVTAPVVDALEGFGRGEVSVPDLQSIVTGAALALDNANASLVAALKLFAEDLEDIWFGMPLEDRSVAVRRRYRSRRDQRSGRREPPSRRCLWMARG